MAPASTPEELEAMFEDAFLLRDPHELGLLFGDNAVLAAANERHEARGANEIAKLLGAMWERDRTFVADPRRILQTRDTALVLAPQHIAVVRRGADRGWRYAISLLSSDDMTAKEEQ
jgi:hypothetical protein